MAALAADTAVALAALSRSSCALAFSANGGIATFKCRATVGRVEVEERAVSGNGASWALRLLQWAGKESGEPAPLLLALPLLLQQVALQLLSLQSLQLLQL